MGKGSGNVILKKTGRASSAVAGREPPQPNSAAAIGHANTVVPSKTLTNYACGKPSGGMGKKGGKK
jgi:hypothetical protein